ncbi:MAG: type II secretion system protein GspL [Steroidobacteraceae bacterium]
MADWLLFRLPRDAAHTPHWLVADERGQLLAAPSVDTGPELAAAARGRQVALVVPGADVLQLVANLPQAGEARLQQLAPFALEDQVSEDIETLHFALGARNAASGDTPVQVVSRALLDEWLARARSFGLEPAAVYADSELAPYLPAHLTLLIDEDHLVLRRDGATPAVLPAADPALALDLVLGAEAAPEDLQVVVYAAPEGWREHGAKFEALRPRVATLKVQLSAGGVLPLLAQGLAAPARINLLQGSYRARTESGTSWRRWRMAAAAAAVLLLVHAGARIWELQRLRGAERALDAAIAQAAAVALPGEPLGGDLRRRVEQRLQLAGSGGRGQGEWLHVLAAVAAAHDNVPVTRIDGLDFKPGEMQLRITGPDATSLEQLSQALRASGYTAQVTSGANEGQGFHGRVELKAGS